jgi:NDP-sugar pyrophosphorylase family protein
MSGIQIVVPMSGFGERFRAAGYAVPKPLIEIDGLPIVAHVIQMFPSETDFVFICNQDHLDSDQYRMRELLNRYCPTGRIVGIPAHKLGPIHAVRQIEHLLDMDRPIVVNYCDFTCYWDWQHFKEYVKLTKCAGAIPAYKGFHPHTLGSTNYAYMKEKDGYVKAIQEKQPYTNDRMNEFASSGTYYFSSAKLMSAAFAEVMERDLSVNGEYYVSLAYTPLLEKGSEVVVYPLQHFMQWGTPQDVAEYVGWSDTFKKFIGPINFGGLNSRGSVIIPMAGLGQRFVNEGYSLTKPLIPVSGKAMVTQATNDLPKTEHQVFVLRQDMPSLEAIKTELSSQFSNAIFKEIPAVSEGQACTTLIGLEALIAEFGPDCGPITVGACDNGALYDRARLRQQLGDPDVDVLVWGARGHANATRHPKMYGWIKESDDQIESISVKSPLLSPATDPIVIGTFTFKRASDLKAAIERLVLRNGRVNNEFYLDSCINDAIESGLKCRLFEVDHFISWGTPNDLKTFEYWQSCFHKWASHPYQITSDERIPQSEHASLVERYCPMVIEIPRGGHA